MKPKTLLVTGFAPFGPNETNPSWEAVRCLPQAIGAYKIVPLLLPVEYGRAAEIAYEKAMEIGASAVLCVGLAANRSAVTPEAIGVNMRDAALPDNAGVLLCGEPIAPDAPAAYFSTLPVRRMTEAILKEGIPAALSYTAGTYVCNDILYTLLHRFSDTLVRTTFLHVPSVKTIPLTDLVRALTAAISVI